MLYNVVNNITAETPRYRVMFAARLLSELITVAAWRDAQHIADELAAHTATIGSARAITLLSKTSSRIKRVPAVPSTLRDTIQHIATGA